MKVTYLQEEALYALIDEALMTSAPASYKLNIAAHP
jgi:hypothetical protein